MEPENSSIPSGIEKVAPFNPIAAAPVPVKAETSPLMSASVEGELVDRDLSLPRLEIAYGVGRLAGLFVPGSLVLDGEELIAEPNQPIKFVPAGMRLYWKEYMTPELFTAGVKPRIFVTEEEVLAAGGTTTWGPDGTPPTFSRAAEIFMFLEKPAALVSSRFFIPGKNGKLFAPCRMYADKAVFRGVAAPLLLAYVGVLRASGLRGGEFELRTVIRRTDTRTRIEAAARFLRLLPEDERPSFVYTA